MRKILCLALAVCVATSGCSAFVSKTQTVNASCSEPDATLQVNGGPTYPGKVQLEARRDKVISLTCYKQGYYPAQKSISHSLSGTGFADWIGAFIFIIPVIGVFTPGSRNLDETDVTINMLQY
jgi:hypothetical protein